MRSLKRAARLAAPLFLLLVTPGCATWFQGSVRVPDPDQHLIFGFAGSKAKVWVLENGKLEDVEVEVVNR